MVKQKKQKLLFPPRYPRGDPRNKLRMKAGAARGRQKQRSARGIPPAAGVMVSYEGRRKESPLMETLELINRMGVDQQCLVMAYEDGEPEMCVTLIKQIHDQIHEWWGGDVPTQSESPELPAA